MLNSEASTSSTQSFSQIESANLVNCLYALYHVKFDISQGFSYDRDSKTHSKAYALPNHHIYFEA